MALQLVLRHRPIGGRIAICGIKPLEHVVFAVPERRLRPQEPVDDLVVGHAREEAVVQVASAGVIAGSSMFVFTLGLTTVWSSRTCVSIQSNAARSSDGIENAASVCRVARTWYATTYTSPTTASAPAAAAAARV